MAKERGLEFKVGVLIVGALAILGAFVFLLGNFSLGKGFRLYVDYNFSGNIQPGAPVKVSGIKVGKVEDVLFFGGRVDPKTNRRVQVRLKVWVQERVRETLRADAEFFVNTAGVLGEQYLEIAPGSHDKPPLDPSVPVVGVDPPRTDLIVARLYEFLDQVTIILHEDKDLIRDVLKNSSTAIRELSALLVENREAIGKLGAVLSAWRERTWWQLTMTFHLDENIVNRSNLGHLSLRSRRAQRRRILAQKDIEQGQAMIRAGEDTIIGAEQDLEKEKILYDKIAEKMQDPGTRRRTAIAEVLKETRVPPGA